MTDFLVNSNGTIGYHDAGKYTSKIELQVDKYEYVKAKTINNIKEYFNDSVYEKSS